MKYIFLLSVTTILFCCKAKELTDKEKEEKAGKEALVLAKKLAVPCIADKVGDLEILFITARNDGLRMSDRSHAVNDIRSKFPEFLSSVDFDNLNSGRVKEFVGHQKEYIEKNCLANAAEAVYREALKKKYDAVAEYERAKNK